jgi:ribose transport system substrate-binding protein
MLGRIKDRVDGIFAVNESATNGLLNAMRSQGLNRKITLMGFDSSAPLLDAVRDGDVIGLIVQDPYRMGYLGVYTLVRHLEGDDVSVGGKNLSTGEYLLTADNLDRDETKQLFDPTLQVKRQIVLPKFEKKK